MDAPTNDGILRDHIKTLKKQIKYMKQQNDLLLCLVNANMPGIRISQETKARAAAPITDTDSDSDSDTGSDSDMKKHTRRRRRRPIA